MFGLFHVLAARAKKLVTVDYGTELYIPEGTCAVKDDRPVGRGKQEIQLSDILLEEIPAGMSLQAYRASCAGERFWDARMLDGLFEKAKSNDSTEWLHTALGYNRLVFFLGTTFLTADGEEVVPFLNLSDALPAFRYVYRIQQPVGGGPGTGDPLLEVLGLYAPTPYAAVVPQKA